MPFRKWKVEPVFLSRKPIPPDKPIFETATNGTLVKCIAQMASLLTVADRIFDEIGSECRLVYERTQRLKVKLQNCEDAVVTLNAKAVHVPISDLERTFQLIREPQFVTHYGHTKYLYLPSTRPPAVDELYGKANATPVPLISAIDRYRSDGRKGSQYFVVTPILGDIEKRRKHRKMLDIETRRPASFALAKDCQEDSDHNSHLSSPSQVVASSVLQQRIKEDGLDRLPSPEELALAASLEYPASVVPVDTTGSSFLRMIKSRRSLIHVDFVIRRKKDKKKSKRRHTVCEGSSKELEDALRNISVTTTSCQTDDVPEVGSLSSSFRRSFSRRRGRATVNNVLRETDRLNQEGQKKSGKTSILDGEKDQSSNNKENTVNSKKSLKLSLKSRNFNPISSISNALSMAVKMRQSSRTAGKQDDGRSSSGNWSASSSTRASVDSDHHHIITPVDFPSSMSRNSAGKDSVLSDATQMDANFRFQGGLSPKHLQSTKYGLTNPSHEKKDNELWTSKMDQDRQSSSSTPERASDSTNTSVALSPYLLRKGGARNLPVPGNLDDGESSVYSVDTDGYYTSMHTDSGLWNAVAQTFKLGDAVISESFKFRRRRESQSSVSTVGNSSINSFLSKTATEVSSSQGSLKRQKPAPQPPPRCSSTPQMPSTQQGLREIEVDRSENSSSPAPFPNGSASESDYESRVRIHSKTKINPSRYPSMCAVSPETSDDEAFETSTFRRNTSAVVNVVVAEVHREPCDTQNVAASSSNKHKSQPPMLQIFSTGNMSPDIMLQTQDTIPKCQSPVINMYGNRSPIQSNFTSSLAAKQFAHSSPVNAKSPISTFFPGTLEISNSPAEKDSFSSAQECSRPNQSSKKFDPIAPSPDIPGSPKQSTVPLKYTPRITVTPIARAQTSSPVAGAMKVRNRIPQTDSSSSNLSTGNSGFNRLTCGNSNRSTLTTNPAHLQKNLSLSSLQNSRPIARVTLDPAGKVVYSSRSLDRRSNEGAQNQSQSFRCDLKPMYATLPMCQNHSPSSSPEKSQSEKYKSGLKISSEVSNAPPVEQNALQSSDFSQAQEQHPMEQKTEGGNQMQKIGSCSSFQQNPEAYSQPSAKDLYFRPSRGGRFCRTYFPAHLISPSINNKPKTVPQMAPMKSLNNESPDFQNPAIYEPNLHPIKGFNASKSLVYSPSQYLNRTNNNPEFNQNVTRFSLTPPDNSGRKPETFHGSTFSRFSQNQPSQFTSRQNSLHGTHFRPLNPASSAFRQPFSSSGYRPGTYSSYNALNVQRRTSPSNFNQVAKPSSYGNVQNLLPTNYTEKSSMSYSDEDDCCSHNSSMSFDSSEAAYEFSKSCSSSLLPSQPPDVIPSSASPRSTLDITSPSRMSASESKLQEHKADGKIFPPTFVKQSTPLKSLSANELFAIIHSSKKRHNIRTESEKSLSPLSSRSSSPGIGLSPVRGICVETGVLGRNHSKPGDRHSWDCNQTMPDRKSLAQDRLGRTKPTSMHDFKMLLLQARSGSSDVSPRPSAAELLKVSPPQSLNTSLSSPPRSLTSSPIKNISLTKSPSPVTVHNTLPSKRAVRTRSPYLTRYDSTYPPILEDCSEESESVCDNYRTADHGIPPAAPFSESSDGCDSKYKNTKCLESNKPNTKVTSTWV